MPRELHRNVRVLLLTASLMSLSFGLAYPYLSEYIYSISGSTSMIGTIVSMRSAVCILSLVLGGYLGDKFGRKRTIGIGTMLLGASQIIYASAHGTLDLFAAATCEGLSALYFPSFNAIIMDTTSQEHLTGVFTLSFVVEHIPYALTPALSGFIRDSYGILGLRACFAVTGVMTIMMGLARVRLLSETLEGTAEVGLRVLWDAYRSLPRDLLSLRAKVRRLIFLRSLCLITATSMFYYFAILYATRYAQVLSFTEWGLITALSSISVLTSLPLSRLIKQSRLAPSYASLILIEGIAIMVFMIPRGIVFITSMVLLNVCGALTYAIERSTIAIETEKNMKARAETFMILSFYIGDALGSYIGGLIYAQHPPNVFLTASTLLLIGSVVGFTILRK